MPTSHWLQLNEIVGVLMATRPTSLLDIGVGFGKYGVLAREYLELWDGREDYNNWTRRIDGIEANRRYSNDLYHWAYDQVHFGNAIDVLPTIDHQYDLVLMVDVLEHFTRSEGAQLIELCKKHRNLLVATPHHPSAQKAAFQNPYEEHKSQWGPGDIRFDAARLIIPNTKSVIVYTGQDVDLVARSFPGAILC